MIIKKESKKNKPFVAVLAFMRFLASVKNSMAIQILLASKAFIAHLTAKGLDLFVNIALVHLQTSFAIELAVTLIALESILASVKEKMSLQTT